MLDLKAVVDDIEAVAKALGRKGEGAAASLSRIKALADKRKPMQQRLEALRAERNEANDAMRALDKKSDEFAKKRDAMRSLSQEAKQLEVQVREVEAELDEAVMHVPNVPAEQAPDGLDEASNVELRKWGQPPSLDFAPKDHVDVGNALGILDMERGVKLSGARFAVLVGAGARMERALLSFMLDMHADKHGYTEVWPPALVHGNAMRGTGQFPKMKEDVFAVPSHSDGEDHKDAGTPDQDLYLIPTAEVPVTNLHAGEILEADQLPVTYTAFTPCFRSEAGSYGRDTRGLIRLHQFDKVELVRFETPENALAAHEELTGHAEAVLQALGLHYRVMDLSCGDMSFAAKRCYDIEVWLPGQDAYREISSCSWFGDFQARRAKIRYRPAPGEKPRLLHTLNGSALAVGRTMVAILEQYQQADGSVKVPAALVPYMGGLEVLRPAS